MSLLSSYKKSGSSFPDQTNNSGKVLVTNGTEVFWEARYTKSEIDTIIEQNGFGAIATEIMINKPSITYPLTGATNFAGELTSSAYSPIVGFSGVHTHSQWQISDMADFSNIADESYTTNITAWQPDFKLISTVMYARVRYKSYNFVSEWSDAVSFTTPSAYTQTPIVTVRGADTPSVLPYIETSEFVSYNGTDTHISTSWRIKEGETVIWSDLENTTKKYTIRVPVGVLQPSTTYTFEARHNSETYADSAWGSLTLTTPAEFDTVPMLVVGTNTSPFLHIYNQDVDTFTKLPTISNAPYDDVLFCKFSPNDDFLYVAQYAGVIRTYERVGNMFNYIQGVSSGIDTSMNFSTDITAAGDLLVVGGAASGYVKMYTIGSNGLLTQITAPFDVAPSVVIKSLKFSPDGNYLVLLFGQSPFFSWYKRNGNTWIKLANPDVMPTATPNNNNGCIDWSPDSSHLAIRNDTQKLITYRRVEDTLTKITDTSSFQSNTEILMYSKDGSKLFAVDTSGIVKTYSVNDNQYTVIANEFSVESNVQSIAFSADNTYMATSKGTTTPYIAVKKRNAGGTYDALANLPAANSFVYSQRAICFSNTGYPQE